MHPPMTSPCSMLQVACVMREVLHMLAHRHGHLRLVSAAAGGVLRVHSAVDSWPSASTDITDRVLLQAASGTFMQKALCTGHLLS